MKFVGLVLAATMMAGCYAEWDLPVKTQRTDPCTNLTQEGYIYVQPTCPSAPRYKPVRIDN